MTAPKFSDSAKKFLAHYARIKTPQGTRLLDTKPGRIALTKNNPLLFALLYFPRLMASAETGNVVSLSEAHLDWYNQLSGWAKPVEAPREWRRAYIAPRSSGKSTTWFTVAPIWAAAHKHCQFTAGISSSARQAEERMSDIKKQFDSNELLRNDYPELCKPARTRGGGYVADRVDKTVRSDGSVFVARGIDTELAGLLHDGKRPGVLLLDDIEATSEGNYSPYMVEQRLETLRQVVLQLNDMARVVVVGTVYLPESIMHQLVKTVQTTEDPAEWIVQENFQTHYYPVLLTDEVTGEQRSLWPERWSLEFILEHLPERPFQMQMMNRPMPKDAQLWRPEDIRIEARQIFPRTIISVDPAVSTKKTSDYTAISVISHDKAAGKMYVRESKQRKMTYKEIIDWLGSYWIPRYPEALAVLFEVNQGGEEWRERYEELELEDKPRYIAISQSVKKETRAEWLYNGYQLKRVVHTEHLPDYENQLLAYPFVAHDDLIDSVSTAYEFFFGRPSNPAGNYSAKASTYA